jgi:hypothetical protein
MKKFFISAALFSVFSSVVFASNAHSGDPVSPARNKSTVNVRKYVQASFDQEFTGASCVKWEPLQDHIYQVGFSYNNERLNAFYDEAGNLVATGRFINESKLPSQVKKNLARRYASYELQQIIEVTQNDQTSYLLVIADEQSKLTVQAYNNGNLIVFKKEKRIL